MRKVVLLAVALILVALLGGCAAEPKNPPDYIKDVVAYEEGTHGIVVYFVLADRYGNETKASGEVHLTITQKVGGFDSQTTVNLFDKQATVSSSDFHRTTVGIGAFERERLLFSFGRISYTEFERKPKGGILAPGTVTIEFTTEGGRTLIGTGDCFFTATDEEETEFQLIDWTVVDYLSTAALQLNFTTTGDIDLVLTNPNGMEADSQHIYDWETETTLELADYREVPLAGPYTLTAKDAVGKVIATEIFDFTGAQVSISNVALTWDYYYIWGYYSLESISFTLRNDGDLPAYICEGELGIGTVEESLYFLSEVVMPGTEKTLSNSIAYFGVTPGEKTMSLQLRDSTDNVVCSYSSPVTPAVAEESQFELTSWSVIDYLNTAALQLNSTTTGDVDLILTNPDGIDTDSTHIYKGFQNTKLHLAGYKEVPDGGQYTLTVEDGVGNAIASETFDFTGAQVSISNVALTWDYYYIWGYYSLESISFTLRNDGDLPAYICEGELGIDTVDESLYFLGEVVMPGEEKTISTSVYLDVTPGEKTVSLELRDDAGKIVCSYSSPVTPAVAEETQFELTSWSVVDSYGTPRLQLSFTTTGDVELIFTNPHGIQTGSRRIYNGFKDTTFDLAGYYEVPDGGEYVLTVKDGVGTTIATQTFNFIGTQVTISDVSLTWSYWEYSDEYWLEGLSFKVTNNGDLPAYIDDVRITLNGLEDTAWLWETLLPGEEKQYAPYVWIMDVSPDPKTFTIELLDSAGKVIASYSAIVTPSE